MTSAAADLFEILSWADLLAAAPEPLARRWVVLARDASPAQAVPTRLRIAEIGRKHAAAASETCCAGYGMPPTMAGWIAALVGRPRWRAFCAFDGARIVSASFLFMRDGRAGHPVAHRIAARG